MVKTKNHLIKLTTHSKIPRELRWKWRWKSVRGVIFRICVFYIDRNMVFIEFHWKICVRPKRNNNNRTIDYSNCVHSPIHSISSWKNEPLLDACELLYSIFTCGWRKQKPFGDNMDGCKFSTKFLRLIEKVLTPHVLW